MRNWWVFTLILFSACSSGQKTIVYHTLDTDFSKGRLTHSQRISLNDLEKFHGHLCDGLVVGALALKQTMYLLYPDEPIDRTNLRIVSKPSPCLIDVGMYLTGGRYQYNSFYVDTSFNGLYIVQRLDTKNAYSVSLKPGVKPTEIDSLGRLAVRQELTACEIDYLKGLEDKFSESLLQADPSSLFTIVQLRNFNWSPKTKNDYIKTDVINKNMFPCSKKVSGKERKT